MEGHLERLRRAEFQAAQRWLTPGARLLELGGGSGYQARLLADHGCLVTSLDLPDRPQPVEPFYPVHVYDGRHIPFPDASFDLIFSSNVLEHVGHLPALLAEQRRVLAPGGRAIHLLPSATWRTWTYAAHYVYLAKCLLGLQRPIPGMLTVTRPAQAIGKRGLATTIKKALFEGPHGVYPNAPSELYYFSRFRWSRLFKANRFRIRAATSNHLFYTGYALLPGLPIPTRQRLSSILGASCHLFVLEPSS
jgi:SAM-dependent methyltransferase